MIIKIKDNVYHIEFQTDYRNMAIRLARYGLEYGIHNKVIDEKTKTHQFPIPEQAVIYLEYSSDVPRNNNYEFIYKGKSVVSIEVTNLNIWEFEMEKMLDKKLYNLVPILIFKYRVALVKAKDNKEELEQIKNNFLTETREIMTQVNRLDSDIKDNEDKDLIIAVLGELITYFDTVFFDGEIKRRGDFEMTWTEEVKGWRQKINEAEAKAEAKVKARIEAKATQAKTETLLEMAKKLLAKGMDIDFVVETTGLSVDEVTKLML